MNINIFFFPLLVFFVAKTKPKQSSGSSGPAPKRADCLPGWRGPSRTPHASPGLRAPLGGGCHSGSHPLMTADTHPSVESGRTVLTTSMTKDRAVSPGGWPGRGVQGGGGMFGFCRCSGRCPGHAGVSDLVASFRPVGLRLERA